MVVIIQYAPDKVKPFSDIFSPYLFSLLMWV